MAEHDEQLLTELRLLGRVAEAPPDAPDRMAAAVVESLSAPAVRRPKPWLTRRRLGMVVAALLAVLVATPPVRAAVVDWLGFGGVRVEIDRGADRPDGEAPPPPAVPPGSAGVEEAADAVTFTVLAPAALGPPHGVEVATDRRTVSMTWTVDGSVVRLDQFDGTLDFTMAKQARGVQYAAVGPADALWFEEPHEVVLLDPDGEQRTETARLAGHTLIWPDGATTLRLEGDLDLAEAVAVAESASPVE